MVAGQRRCLRSLIREFAIANSTRSNVSSKRSTVSLSETRSNLRITRSSERLSERDRQLRVGHVHNASMKCLKTQRSVERAERIRSENRLKMINEDCLAATQR